MSNTKETGPIYELSPDLKTRCHKMNRRDFLKLATAFGTTAGILFGCGKKEVTATELKPIETPGADETKQPQPSPTPKEPKESALPEAQPATQKEQNETSSLEEITSKNAIKEIDPTSFKQEFSGEYQGVNIKGSITTDKSLKGQLDEVREPNNVMIEFVAEHQVYEMYAYSIKRDGGTPLDKESYLKLWKEAQNGGSWEQIKFKVPDIQKGWVEVYPMYNGKEPLDTNKSITSININLVNSSVFSSNFTFTNEYAVGFGIVVKDNQLITYTGVDYLNASGNKRESAAHVIGLNSMIPAGGYTKVSNKDFAHLVKFLGQNIQIKP